MIPENEPLATLIQENEPLQSVSACLPDASMSSHHLCVSAAPRVPTAKKAFAARKTHAADARQKRVFLLLRKMRMQRTMHGESVRVCPFVADCRNHGHRDARPRCSTHLLRGPWYRLTLCAGVCVCVRV